jgi:hypothetical protein
MKKIMVGLSLLVLAGSLFALNPPSYVGRNIHEVLKEVDGVKVHYTIGKMEAYRIFLNDTSNICFWIESEKIRSVEYSRIYYSTTSLNFGDTINSSMHKKIFDYLIEYCSLGEPDNKTRDIVYWKGSKVGEYFMNSEIVSYTISISDLTGDGVCEGWSN